MQLKVLLIHNLGVRDAFLGALVVESHRTFQSQSQMTESLGKAVWLFYLM